MRLKTFKKNIFYFFLVLLLAGCDQLPASFSLKYKAADVCHKKENKKKNSMTYHPYGVPQPYMMPHMYPYSMTNPYSMPYMSPYGVPHPYMMPHMMLPQ